MHEEKAPECFFKDSILTLTEAESRLSLGMTSNKTYHFKPQPTIIDLYKYGHPQLTYLPPFFCPNFFFGKSMAQKYPTYP